MVNIEMTPQIARNVCCKNAPDRIAGYFTKAKLCEMFQCLYGIPANENKSKLDLAYACCDFVRNEIRTADLTKNLH